MLSEALTSLEDVKSRLQQSLLQKPEYRALLVIDHATSQLVDVLSPFEPDVVGDRENRTEGAAADEAFIETPARPDAPAADGLNVGDSVDCAANEPAQPALPLREPLEIPSDIDLSEPATEAPAPMAVAVDESPAVEDTAPHAAIPLREPLKASSAIDRSERASEAPPFAAVAIDESPGAAAAPAPIPAIFRMAAALRELAAATPETAHLADPDQPATVSTIATWNGPAEPASNPGRQADYAGDAPLPEDFAADESAAVAPTPATSTAGLIAAPNESVGGATTNSPPRDGVATPARAAAVAANAAEAPVSRMAALYMSIGDALNDGPSEEAPTPPAAASGMAATLYETVGDAPSENHAEEAPIPLTSAFHELVDRSEPADESASGMAATLYETVGDAPDPLLVEDPIGDAPIEPPVAADAPTRARSGMELLISKTTQAAPVANAPAPRSYLPYIAAQRLLQPRRY